MLKTRKNIPLAIIGILSVLAAMLLLLWVNTTNSQQSIPAIFPDVYFEGQYRVGDGPWHPVKEGQHIPATQGDVTLQGLFHMVLPSGEYIAPAGADTPLAFYINHVRITVQESGHPLYTLDAEHANTGEDLCGEMCLCYRLITDEPVTLLFHNPHRFGNDTAIDDFLEELSVYGDYSFEKNFTAAGSLERNAGLAFVVAAFVVLGTALVSALLQVEGSSKLWLIGLCILFAGGYFVYRAKGVFFWSDSIIGNTAVLGICMMMYMLCVCALITTIVPKNVHRISVVAVTVLGCACAAITVLCLVTDIYFYDTWLYWVIPQSIANIILLACLIPSFHQASNVQKTGTVGAIVLLGSFEADVVGTAFGWWRDGLVSQHVFVVLFFIALVLAWQLIPRNIHAARKAKEMEEEQKAIRAQLQESRIAIMISQIQPHFIYNTLGTIQQLCKENPEQASNLIHRFSLYLRGNFSELDNTTPIRFSKELEHVHCYTEIELVRFPDMTVHYDIQTEDFLLPALTVQPLVENAIKHGLMGLEEGGTVTISTYETDTHYCVSVVDDGVGFDENDPHDKRKHIGIRNTRERLALICGGSLTVASEKGKGTSALIQIPKEGKEL